MSAHLLTRRELVVGSLAFSAGAVALGLTGCGQAAEVVVPLVVPVIVGEVLHDFYLFAKQHFSGSFSSGQVLTSPPSGVEFVNNLDPEAGGNFQKAGLRDSFCTPVVMHRRQRERLLQLAQEGSSWSLITGGMSGSQVFQIHTDWLEWLLYEDNCNLRVNGNSTFEACGVNNCDIPVDRQKFLDVNDREVTLVFTLDGGSPEHSEAHRKDHITTWHGCPTVKRSPDECKF